MHQASEDHGPDAAGRPGGAAYSTALSLNITDKVHFNLKKKCISVDKMPTNFSTINITTALLHINIKLHQIF